MEPFRPLVDRAVRDMELSGFGREQKRELVQVLNEQIQMDGRSQYTVNAIRIFARSTLSALDNEDLDRLTFPQFDYEL